MISLNFKSYFPTGFSPAWLFNWDFSICAGSKHFMGNLA